MKYLFNIYVIQFDVFDKFIGYTALLLAGSLYCSKKSHCQIKKRLYLLCLKLANRVKIVLSLQCIPVKSFELKDIRRTLKYLEKF